MKNKTKNTGNENEQEQPQFKEVDIIREVKIIQNVNTGKIELTLKLKDYDLDDLLLDSNSPIHKKTIGKIKIEVLE